MRFCESRNCCACPFYVSFYMSPFMSYAAEVADVFARLGCTPETWGVRMSKLSGGRLLGRFLAATRDKLRELAAKLQVRHLANVG